jgi:hypothetical protein
MKRKLEKLSRSWERRGLFIFLHHHRFAIQFGSEVGKSAVRLTRVEKVKRGNAQISWEFALAVDTKARVFRL